jgi:hypothetical protein
MPHYLIILLVAAAWSFSHGAQPSNQLAQPAAVCRTAAACQLTPNAVAMACSGGACVPECLPGFNLVGAACISGGLTDLAKVLCHQQCCKWIWRHCCSVVQHRTANRSTTCVIL